MEMILTFICSVIKAVLLSNLPFYGFIIFMYFLLKKLSPKGNISSRFFTAINTENENKIFKISEFLMNYILNNIAIFCFIFIVSATVVVFYDNILIYSFMCSSSALRLQHYLMESLLTIILATFGLIAVFSSLNKQYYLFFSSKDIIDALKIKECIFSTSIIYFLCVISVSMYYACYYLIDSKYNTDIFKVFFFTISIISAIVVVFYVLKMFYSIIKFLFSKKTEYKLLDSLHLDVHEKLYNITIQNEQEIYDGLDYLFIKNSKHKHITKEKISFISFIDNSNSFTEDIKNKLVRNTFLWSFIISFLLICFNYKKDFQQSAIIILVAIALSSLVNFVICKSLYKTKLKDIIIHIHMWSWGFLITIENEKYYSATTKSKITNSTYDEYFKSIYNIISFYRKVLSFNKEYASKSLNYILNKFDNGECDYLLLSICMFLYYKNYDINKKELVSLKKYIENMGVGYELLRNNLSAIITDIFRNDLTSDIDSFVQLIKNSNKIKVKHILYFPQLSQI
ncbi:MAG: hypothetical protein J1E81_00960 [Eubacterium sp.]|nr:hypothetical protein [Eubacterium sp.]